MSMVSGIVRANQALGPDPARLAIHLDLGDDGHDGVAAIGVGDAAPREHFAS